MTSPLPASTPFALVLLGVSGCGKTRLGRALAAELGIPFVDADDFHSDSNRAKMAAGIPLTDSDRHPWLATLRETLAAELARGQSVILACSALKRAYRDLLREAGPAVRFVHLAAPRAVLLDRLQARSGHFFPPGLLDSQLAELETPADDEALILDARADIPSLVARVLDRPVPGQTRIG